MKMKKAIVKLETILTLIACPFVLAIHDVAPVAPLKATHRTDLSHKLGAIFCRNPGVMNMSGLWQAQIFDTQIEGQLLKIRPGTAVSPEQLQKAGEILASQHKHSGYSYGMCDSKTAWVATTPAPLPFAGQLPGKQEAEIDWGRMRNYCRLTRLDFAPARSGLPRNLETVGESKVSSSLKVSTSLLEDGTLAVTCYPKYAKGIGPELWYLIPVKNGPLATVPHANLLRAPQSRSTGSALLGWINQVRGEYHLDKLTLNNQKLKKMKALQKMNRTVHHDEAQLQKVQAAIQVSGGLFVGENRVKGKNLAQMAWLLWNSPRHRELILSKKASSLMVDMVDLKDEQIAILTFAKY
jgi:hypothetical protein